jgi:DNA (cytosine-5)-methyltransferase 1
MRVISTFSAPGGLDYGLVKAGHYIVWACDKDADAAQTYAKNVSNNILTGDVRKMSTGDIPEADVVVGGFPCLGFTIANLQRKIEDERNYLFLQLLRIVEAKKPKYVLMENVPGILSLGKGRIVEEILKLFQDAGYDIYYEMLNAADYGVPEIRHRVFFFGKRKDLEKHIVPPQPTRAVNPVMRLDGVLLKKWVTVREAIGDLPEPNHDIANHQGTKHKVKITGYIGNRPTAWDKPSPTITGRGSRTGGPVIIPHPNLHRRLTVRECARLQSFPDDFIFYGSISAQYAQVGNAVPPLLAYHLGRSLCEATGEKPKPFSPEEWKLPWLRCEANATIVQ